MIGLLLLIGIVNCLDRSTLAIANSTISGELGLSATAMGILLSVFSWSYAFAQLPAGPLLDRFGARTVLGIGLLVWSVAQGAGGLVRGMHDHPTEALPPWDFGLRALTTYLSRLGQPVRQNP
ncbi:MFS transporter [Streptomyces cavernicola]|uniref:MFS transporter n=1 Tax=Streptomyces cavernicola TaxID=3043613 RepID=A0ABT6SE57_9ACTN|nr:MFS transporter [Streptomyces sp. B-S-A6]MDI3406482.1 MFS transporter [Streptomyces sp. B-S-A6]